MLKPYQSFDNKNDNNETVFLSFLDNRSFVNKIEERKEEEKKEKLIDDQDSSREETMTFGCLAAEEK